MDSDSIWSVNPDPDPGGQKLPTKSFSIMAAYNSALLLSLSALAAKHSTLLLSLATPAAYHSTLLLFLFTL